MTKIIFVLMLITHSSQGVQRREIDTFQHDGDCKQLRDTLNSIRTAPGKYMCWLGAKDGPLLVPPREYLQ